MEKRTCKLCFRTFSNGRALGGHMRSHMTMLSPSPQAQKLQHPQNEPPSSSSSSASSSSEEAEDYAGNKAPCYGLRENPPKSSRFSDPDFSFAVDASSVVQDRESETESPKHVHGSRSKRPRASVAGLNPKPDTEPEPLSSVSDTTTEEDVARCLMMLSRDIWIRNSKREAADYESQDSKEEGEEHEEEEEEEEEDDDSKLKSGPPKGRSRYQCETCKKVFRSYQALGGHRSSHKKADGERAQVGDSGGANAGAGDRRRIHQCPVCFRVFGSGQALGGHKRSHLSASAAAAPATLADNSIDLNLPAPLEDDDMSQIEHSAVSDAGFVDPAKH